MGKLTFPPVDLDFQSRFALEAWESKGITNLSPQSATEGLPRWYETHDCGDFADHIDTWSERTHHGVAVWDIQGCTVCGNTWDVLSDASDESVIEAVFPCPPDVEAEVF